MRREAIRRTLAQRAGDAPNASAIAEATLSAWREVADRLTPVIGVRGVDVLFSRALHVTSATFPWLAITGDHEDSTAPLASFRARIENCDTAVAAEASNALLVNFTELLATLIGESLTEQLLGSVLSPPPPPPPPPPPRTPASKQEIAS
jgi:hypothetical protein